MSVNIIKKTNVKKLIQRIFRRKKADKRIIDVRFELDYEYRITSIVITQNTTDFKSDEVLLLDVLKSGATSIEMQMADDNLENELKDL